LIDVYLKQLKMETSELTKEQKLEVIDEILAKYERDERYQWYICNNVKDAAYIKGYDDSLRTAVDLIPELLMVKPADESITSEWFGSVFGRQNRPRRLAALRRVREMVEGGMEIDFSVLLKKNYEL
jgi:hypothetical protein